MAQEVYRKPLSSTKLQVIGLSLDDFANDKIEVWPENWPAYELFSWMHTQWLTTMGHRYGLNYATLYMKMDRMGLSAEEFELLEFDVRIMESAALQQMADDAEDSAKKTA